MDVIAWATDPVEESILRGFGDELADGRQPQVDGSRRKTRGFEARAVLLDDRAAEGRPGLAVPRRPVPRHKILQSPGISPFGVDRAHRIDGQRNDGPPIGGRRGQQNEAGRGICAHRSASGSCSCSGTPGCHSRQSERSASGMKRRSARVRWMRAWQAAQTVTSEP